MASSALSNPSVLGEEFVYGSSWLIPKVLTLLLLLTFGLIVGYGATGIRSKLLGRDAKAHWVWTMIKGVGALLTSVYLILYTMITIQDAIYQPFPMDNTTAILDISLAVLVVFPFSGLATEYLVSLQATLNTEQKHSYHGMSLRCPHCHAIYNYNTEHLEEGYVSCQNCGKTVSFNTAEIV